MGKKKIIIEGVNVDTGQIFRPSDWAERMSGKLSTFKKRRLHYSPLLKPALKNGNKCVILDQELQESNPNLFNSVLKFAKSNQLKIYEIDEENTEQEDAN